ncbi:MAG TPA: metal ABC transporter substrate-binding protein [Opitutaceae bacterium]|nr:metal ABC transporter substrate-binding protein [Opitutaceae bacterium]
MTAVRRLVFALIVGASFGWGSPLFAATPLRVVTVHTVLTEIAQTLGESDVDVLPLVAPGTDPHVYEPTPGDVRRFKEADLVLAAGLGMESYLPRLAGELRPDAIISVGDRLSPELLLKGGPHNHDGSHGHAHSHAHVDGVDPHWWHGVPQVIAATHIVANAFSERRPAQAGLFRARAESYVRRLESLRAWAKTEMAAIPAERRVLVSSHDAFGYLAHEHSFTVYPLLGFSTAGEVDARHVARIIRLIRAKNIHAVFSERSTSPRVIEAIVRETSAKLAPALSADGLGRDPALSTYEGMMRFNISTIVEALR